MSPGSSLLISLLISSLAFLIRRWYQNKRRNPKSLPLHPGPKPIPFLGNISDVPKLYPWLKIAEWKHTYGDITRVQAFGNNTLFLNSWKAANDLLGKRSTIYSDRPEQVMYHEITGWGWVLFAMRYGNEWRQQRKMFHQYFHSDASKQFRPSQVIELKALLLRLLDSPQFFLDHISHMSISTMLRVTYGIEVSGTDDTYDTILKDAAGIVAITGVPGTFIVDYIPPLRYLPEWFPGATFKKLGRIWKKEVEKFRHYPFTIGKQYLGKGNPLPSALSLMLKELKESQNEKLSEDMIRDVTAAGFGAGSDTTSASIQQFFLAMVLNPEVQRKAQAQLDAVVGKDRLPDFDDLPSLPYIEAIMMEVLRFHPVAPLAIPHMNMQDDEYEGHFIPKCTTVIANSWAMLHDEDVYPNPFSFLPERFLDSEGKIDPHIRPPDCIAFGFGRRICPGRYMAVNTLMITIAYILSIFDIEYAVDEQGKRIPVSGKVSSGLSTHPLPFKCNIKPRKKVNVEVIRRLLV